MSITFNSAGGFLNGTISSSGNDVFITTSGSVGSLNLGNLQLTGSQVIEKDTSGNVRNKKTYNADGSITQEKFDAAGKTTETKIKDPAKGKESVRSGSATTNQIEFQQNSAGAFITVSGSTPGYNIIKTGATNDFRLIRQTSDFFYANNLAIFTVGVDDNPKSWYINPSVGAGASAASLIQVSMSGDVIIKGKLTAKELHTEFTSASIIYESGSTQFGDTLDDTHNFSGSFNVVGNITASGNITSSLTSTGSFGKVIATTIDGTLSDSTRTDITSILATDLVLGEDSQTKIDFETVNEIHFDVNNTELLNLTGTKISGSLISTGSFGKVIGTTIDGTLSTAAQGNITSLGTLSGLNVSGNITASGNISASGLIASSLTNLTTFTALGNLDIGPYNFRTRTLQSDVGTGTIPISISSTTKCTNLNADLLDDQEGSYYTSFLNATGNITASNISSSGTITAEHIVSSDDMEVTDDLSVGGVLSVAGDIQHIGDTDTKIVFGTDSITLRAGATELFKVTEASPDTISFGAAISSNITASGQISSSGTGSFTGGGIFGSRVGIGTTSPTKELQVTGDISASGDLYVDDIIADDITGTLQTGVQSNITRIGTITHGTWNATTIEMAKVKQLDVNHFAYYISSTGNGDTKYFIPLNSLSENTTGNPFNRFFAPYDGVFKKVIFNARDNDPGDVEVFFHTGSAAASPINAVQSITIGSTVDDTSYEANFSASICKVSKGDHYSVAIQGTNEVVNYWHGTWAIEYDTST